MTDNFTPNVERKSLRTQEEIDAAYPEHKKFTKEVDAQIMAAQRMIDHLKREGFEFSQWVEDDEYEGERLALRSVGRETIFAAFGIDYNKFMAEKEDMLKQIRMSYND